MNIKNVVGDPPCANCIIQAICSQPCNEIFKYGAQVSRLHSEIMEYHHRSEERIYYELKYSLYLNCQRRIQQKLNLKIQRI
jgi:hypothetical protein